MEKRNDVSYEEEDEENDIQEDDDKFFENGEKVKQTREKVVEHLEERVEYLKKKEMENKGAYSYTNRKRDSGAGPVRIGESMSIRGDLYSMLFTTCLHAEYIYYYE